MKRKFIRAHNVGFLTERFVDNWGWRKLAMDYSIELGDIGYSNGEYGAYLTMEFEGYSIQVRVTFDFQKAQRGGFTDPSWDDHLEYLGYDIIRMEALDEETDESDVATRFKKFMSLYSDTITSEVERRLSER